MVSIDGEDFQKPYYMPPINLSKPNPFKKEWEKGHMSHERGNPEK